MLKLSALHFLPHQGYALKLNHNNALLVATNVSEGVWMYQLTDNGLAAEITAKGTKYYRDDDLNKASGK